MNIYQKGKSRYITSTLDGKDYSLTTGHFKKHLDLRNVALADYFEKHEGIERDSCQACGKPAAFHGYHPNNSVKWHSVCGDSACAKVMYSRAHLSRTPENWAAASEKRRQTFRDNPKVLAARTKNIDAANREVGEDGLTGYERTAKGRKATLLEKHGREDYANWDKSKETWANKSEEAVVAHGKIIGDNWSAKPEEQKRAEIEKRRATNIKKYGMECPGNLNVFAGYSKMASSLFQQLDINQNADYKPKNKEFSLLGKLFDFRIGQKLIEFNGDYWHANPKKRSADFLVGRARKRTAAEIWEADAKKIKLAEDAGYEVKVVWESDFKKNPKRVVEECLVWLKQ